MIHRRDIAFFATQPAQIAYLDSAAGALSPRSVLEQTMAFVQTHPMVGHRSAYRLAEVVTQELENVRADVAAWFGAAREEVVFTANATAGLQLASLIFAHKLGAGDEILISGVEHHAGYATLLKMATEQKCTIKFFTPSPDTLLFNPDVIPFSAQTRLMVVSLSSNVSGNVWQTEDDLKKVIAQAQAQGCCVIVDAAQYAPFHRFNFEQLGADAVVFSGYKMMALPGVGVMLLNKRHHKNIALQLSGGGAIIRVTEEQIIDAPMPQRLEFGTYNIPAIYSLGRCLQLYKNVDLPAERERLDGYVRRVAATLQQVGAQVFVSAALGNHLISWHTKKMHAHDLVEALDQRGIMVRSGILCASNYLQFLGVPSVVRASFHYYSTDDDVEKLCTALREVLGS